MFETLPTVGVWERLSGTTWKAKGNPTYETLKIQPRWLDPGTWQLTMPYSSGALLFEKHRLVTFDWRDGRIYTGIITSHNPSVDENGQPQLAVSGIGAMSLIGFALAYPDPTLPASHVDQPVRGNYGTASAEDVVLELIADNLRDRYGLAINVPTSLHRGTNVSARPQFDNLLELVQTKAKAGGIGVDIQLVPITGTRATLSVVVTIPRDKSNRVTLGIPEGSTWSNNDTAPTVTDVVVGGAGDLNSRVFIDYTTTEATDAAAVWGWRREAFVDGPASFDTPELEEAGGEAITGGAEASNLSVTAVEPEAALAFRDFTNGDTVTMELLDGLAIVDRITALEVSVEASGWSVAPSFGNPDANDTQLEQAQAIRALRRTVDRLGTTKVGRS